MTTKTKTEAPAAPTDYSAGQAEIDKMIKFHGHPVGAQLLREVLGWISREAAEAARHRPQNRPAWLQGWNPPHLRQLAELCSAYAPEVGTINAPTDPDMFADATSPERVMQNGINDMQAQLAEIESHRAQVVRERTAAAAGNGHGAVEQMTTVTIGSGDGIDVVEVPADSVPSPAEPAVEILREQLGAEPIAVEAVTTGATADGWAIIESGRKVYRPDPTTDEIMHSMCDRRCGPDCTTPAPVFHKPDPAPDEPSPANADEARAVQGGPAPF